MKATTPCVLVGHLPAAHDDYDTSVSTDEAPRLDYIELARALHGAPAPQPLAGTPLYPLLHRLERRLNLDLSLALRAAVDSRGYSTLISTSEKIAIPLAAVLCALGRRTPHVVVAHKLSTGIKTRIWKLMELHRTFAATICVSRPQAEYAVQELGLEPVRVHFVYDKVDHRFFRPLGVDDDGYVLAVGQEQRDYGTLLRGLEGSGLRLVVVASSPWARNTVIPSAPGALTVLRHIPYRRLRELYARARVVALPLMDVDYAAGSNGLLEAMAMGRPIVATRTRGLADYVEHGAEAMLVAPGNSEAWRSTILDLWERPRTRAALGERARDKVEQVMNLDRYIDALVRISRSVLAAPQ